MLIALVTGPGLIASPATVMGSGLGGADLVSELPSLGIRSLLSILRQSGPGSGLGEGGSTSDLCTVINAGLDESPGS